MKVYFN